MAGGIAVQHGTDIGNPMGAGTQIIQGKTYQQYSPEWYDAMRQSKITNASANGQAAGAYASGAMTSLNGLLPGGGIGGPFPSGSNDPGAGGGPGAGGPGGGGLPPSLELADPSASNAAIFAKAKDAVGQQSRAAINSLNDEMAGQGMSGSGFQGQQLENIIASGAGNLGQVSRDLASKNADTANDFAKTRYQGGITERGQNIQSQEANAQLELAREQQRQNMIMSLLKLPANYLSSPTSSNSMTSLLY